MATRQRRSFWSDIYQSSKVNRLSLPAALLYTWAIANFDDYGFQEGDPRVIKGVIFPKRDDMTVEKIEELTNEIVSINDDPPLWKIYIVGQDIFIQDPVWFQRQSFHGIRKKPSKILKLLVEHQVDTRLTPELVSEGCQFGSLSEEKLSEVKLSEESRTLSKFLLQEIQKWYPKFKPPATLVGWSKGIDEMIRLDKRTPEEIKETIRWCQQDVFWRKNILSGTTLRLKFNRLQAEIISPAGKGGPKKQDGIDKATQKLKDAISGKSKGIEHKPG